MTSILPLTLPSFRLDGRRALVSGAGRGIGMAAALGLAQAGAHVTLVARTVSEINAVRDDIAALGGLADILGLDVTDSVAVTNACGACAPFDILVNSAGMNRPSTLSELKDEDLEAVLNLNVKAAFYLARAVSKGMVMGGKGGCIINVSSQMGHVGGPKRTVYCASKHALEGFSKALAWELGEHAIRVNTLCPTFIETAMTADMLANPVFKEFVTSKIALGRVGCLQEIMGAIVFLASDASSLMTGSALMLDGGWTAA